MNIKQFHQCGEELYWKGCYAGFRNWKKYVTDESFAHPAKMAPKLCDRIFKHLKKLELLKKGDTVVDFMAGINTTGIIASLHGCDSVAVELEPHFIKMIEANKVKCEATMQRGLNWQVIQGDSRQLSEILKDKDCIGVISPPYENIEIGKGLNTKPPREGTKDQSGRTPTAPSQTEIKYSKNPNNIGNLPDKQLIGVISPPYKNISVGKNAPSIDKKKQWENYRKSGGGMSYDAFCKYQENQSKEYSEDPNNISNLPDKQLVGITSPPYANRMDGGSSKEGYSHITPYDSKDKPEDYRKRWPTERDSKNIGNLMEGVDHQDERESYLSAMLKVYQEAFKSGISPLVTVTKNPTRDGKLRRLDIDTAKLLMMAGYHIIDYHRALLFEEHHQATLNGDVKKELKGRVSFFKRLSHSKGNVIAQWEDIIIGAIPEA